MILDRFGKEHHELLIRQLFHIKQLSSESEYIEKFSELVDQLTTYESHTDPLYYTMRFIDGLKNEFKSAVLIQRPQDLDTACILALLQEEVSENDKRRDGRRADSFQSSKSVGRHPLPLPPPPKLDSLGGLLSQNSIEAALMRTSGRRCGTFVVLKACASNVQRNGPTTISVLKLFSCMLFRSCGMSCRVKMRML